MIQKLIKNMKKVVKSMKKSMSVLVAAFCLPLAAVAGCRGPSADGARPGEVDSQSMGAAGPPRFSADRPVALAVIVDPTSPPLRYGGAEVRRVFGHLVSGGYLPEGSTVALIQVGRRARIVRDGRADAPDLFIQALDGLTRDRQVETGSDVAGGLDAAREWLRGQAAAGIRQRGILCWSDLVADPAKDLGGSTRPFRPAASVEWAPADAGIVLVAVGVKPETAKFLRRAWDGRLRWAAFHAPGHAVSLESDLPFSEPPVL